MENVDAHPVISGMHHITAIAGDPQRNLDFYVGVLGQRLIKKTVNFDDPGTYHFYFADYVGTPGTVLTFFPWAGARKGIKGSGEATAVAYHVAPDALPGWRERLAAHGIAATAGERFGDSLLSFEDPDGMTIELVGSVDAPAVAPWSSGPVPAELALLGLHSTTLQVRDADASAELLHKVFGWRESAREGNRRRMAIPGDVAGRLVDIVALPDLPRGRQGAGSIHHIAYRTPDDATQALWRTQITGAGYDVTPVRDRQYFHSIYFYEPNGVLYEVATDTPGFLWDESMDALGSALKLPPWLEPQRVQIEASLATVKDPLTV